MSSLAPWRGFLRLMTEEKQKSSMFFHKSPFITFTALATISLGLAACQEEQRAENPIRPVKVTVAQQESGDILKSFSGVIRARTESTLGFRVPGKIVERAVDVGDRVEAGQVIARLDNKDLVLSENSADAAVLSAKTRLAVAKDALKRAEALRPQGYTPEAVVDQRRLEADAAQSALEAAEVQARQAKNSTSYAILTADRRGIVTAVHAEPGQVVSPGTPVVSFAESGEMDLALNVPEQDVVHLEIGEPVKLRLWASDAVQAAGKIREIAGQADPGSRTYAVRVALSDPPSSIRLGMTATAELPIGQHSPHIPIPLAALTQIDGKQAVFVADRTASTVSARFVETDGVKSENVKVVSGLKSGDVVITGGVQFLSDGIAVRLPKDLVQTASAGPDLTKDK